MTVWLAPGKLKTAGLQGVHGLIDEPADAVVVGPDAGGKSHAALPSSSIWMVRRCGAAGFVTVIVAVRDSKDRKGPAPVFTPEEWLAFLDGVRADEFSL